MPLRSPRVAPLPTLPPALAGSCTSEAVTTTLATLGPSAPADSSSGSSKLVRRKWPRWFTPTVISKPSAVRLTGSVLPLYCSPAFKQRMSSLSPVALKALAKPRTESSEDRSHCIGTATPAFGSDSTAAMISSLASSAFSIVRHARKTLWPLATSFCAALKPIPELDPVMMMFLAPAGDASAGGVPVESPVIRQEAAAKAGENTNARLLVGAGPSLGTEEG
mmetsp:Transcript_24271/g.67494  ORF Transcript_24271/g.67494 Transcript_24271/m.67494 type:complete len:221 (-) Transcript_24271:286-948(-)